MNETTSKPSNRLWLAVAGVFTVIFLFNTGLVGEWGRWYSDWPPLRWQTEALLKGSLAIANTPTEIWEDQVWYNGGAEQVWGLGVPLWRLPFEFLAHITGQSAFPDRLAFGVALFLIAYWTLKLFLRLPDRLEPNEILVALCHPVRLPVVLALLLFPPILNTCRFHFAVYDEVEVYTYFAAIALFLGIVSFSRNPSATKLRYLALVAGVAPLVRPTLGGYAVVTLIFLLYLSWKARLRLWHLPVAVGLFSLGGVLLYLTNAQRFGSGLEFGHQINLNGFPVWYFTRFYSPYEHEAWGSAARELFGSLFCVTNLNGFDHLKPDFFWGQSETPRWRQFYMTTYGFSFLVLVLAGWAVPVWKKLFRATPTSTTDSKPVPSIGTPQKATCTLLIQSASVPNPPCRAEASSEGGSPTHSQPASEAEMAAVWSFLSAIPLVVFYLHAPSISSRYVLDFAPAFAVDMVALLLFIEARFATQLKSNGTFSKTVLSSAVLWLGWQVLTVENSNVIRSRPISAEELAKFMAHTWPPAPVFPSSYGLGTNAPTQPMIPFNTAGWDRRNGDLETVASLFISDPEFVELHLAPLAGSDAKRVDYSKVQAKIGLESLAIKSVVSSPEGKIVTFDAPKRDVYRKGIQVVFIAYVDKQMPVTKESPLRMLKVAWKQPTGEGDSHAKVAKAAKAQQTALK